MSDIIDFGKEHEKRHGPDLGCVWIDDHGTKWLKFSCSYEFENRFFGFQIWATSIENAEERINALKQTVRIDGQIYTEIDQ